MEGVAQMNKCGAWTAMTGVGYPPYVNITYEGEDVIITVRGEPTVREGAHVCMYKPGPGNCVPGGPTCNNYCNMAPEKGPMQDHPLPCTHVEEGKFVQVRMPRVDWDEIMERLK